MLKRILRILKNRYILAILFFVVWVGFLDNNNLIRTMKARKALKELRTTKAFYLNEINENQRVLKELTENKESFEKFARETYFLKKPSEEIFIIEEE